MATPYSTPRYPGAPNPTPRSTAKNPRAPIHNPYDKFTQPEFDAWIGDITGALKRALGREDAPSLSAPARRELTSPDEDEGALEDSFAEVRARRLAKGKERAREEDFEDELDVSERVDESAWGMPFDDGEDYGSSSEEEEEDKVAEQRGTEVIDLLSGEDEGEDAEEDDVAPSDEDEAVSGTALVSDDEDEKTSEESSDSGDEDGERAPVEEEEDVANDVERSDEDEDEEEEEERQNSPAPAQPNHPDVTEILDSDEELEEQESTPNHHAVPARFLRKPGFASNAVSKKGGTIEDDAADEDGVEDNEEGDAEPFPPQADEEDTVDIPDPWQGPREFAEDYYSSGDVPSTTLERGNPHVLPTEADDNELVDDESTQPLEIPDPWEGPRTFAEDYYAGGDVHPQSLDSLTPSHLTPPDEGNLSIPGISSISTAAQGTSLPIVDSQQGADEAVGIDDLYADIDSTQRLTHADGMDDDKGGVTEDARPPSPSPTNLTTHVDWNYPPAFPGRTATGPGHIADEDHDIIAISDDEDNDSFLNQDVPRHSTSLGHTQESAAGGSSDLASMSFYTDLDLYDVGRLDEEGVYEPVSPNGFDFGDLPPSRGESHLDNQVVPFEVEKSKSSRFISSVVAAADAASLIDQEPTVVEMGKTDGLVVEGNGVEDVQPSTLGETLDVALITGDDDQSSAMDYLVVDEVAIEEGVAEESATFEPVQGESITQTDVKDLHVEADVGEDLSGEYPAPVSADPTVPDPASIAQTPASPISRARSPTDSIASSSGDVQEAKPLPGHAALLPMFNQIAAARSPSGLFTPLTVFDSSSATPELQQDDVDGEVASNVEAVQDQSGEPETVNEASVEDVAPVDDVVSELMDDANLPESIDEESAPPPDPSPSHEELIVADDHLADAPEDGSVLHSQRTGSPDEREESPATDIDADAEGEIDPDYLPSEEDPVEGSSVATPDAIGDEGSIPLETTGAAESAVAEDAVIASPSVDKEDDPFTGGYIDRSAPVQVEHDSQPLVEMPLAADEATGNGTAEDAEGLAEESDTHTDVAPSQETVMDESRDEVRLLKRKRKSPPIVERPTRQLRSRTTKSIDMGRATELPVKSKRANGKGKGKQRARQESDGEDGVSIAPSVASETTSGSSSAAAQQLLIPGSRATSRASSVVSNAPSTYSGLSQPSPTIMRTLVNNGHNLPPPPFMHDNGVLRHHHGARPVLPAIVPPIRRQPSQPAKPPPTASEQSRRSSAELASPQSARSSQPSRPSPPPRPSPQPPASLPSIAASTSSPVTRANCRYHTISLPEDEDEDGPRLFFAVPGCSLGNGELMKEESIQDHGDVHGEDISKLVTNVEDLDLSPYLVGVLRQLVGVDLLREQEVLYLPRPGDTVTVKRNRRRSQRAPHAHVDPISPAQRETISARTLSNGGFIRKSGLKKTISMPPPSQASVSTSGGSASRAGKRSDRGSMAGSSFSGSDLSDLDDDEDMPPPKRAKDTHPEPAPELASEATAESDEAAGSSQAPAANGDKTASISVARRSKRRKLGSDVLAYKPDPHGESDGSEEEEGEDGPKKRKRGGRKRDVKRTRTEEVVDTSAEGSVEKLKRRRSRAVDKVEAGESA
ncbi:hypothetical protein C8Q80DRAFT_1149682 [Daedaleopsis nitida]|nr:hypothetical protein C8Q80DRAFT_1149682 [Daedaleopsis nitida]